VALPNTPSSAPFTSEPAILATDILRGAEAIAVFLFGTANARRQVYRLSTEVPPGMRLPTFKLGNGTLCARRSAILRWINEQELARTSGEAAQDFAGTR
jgi:hypothetical protein